MKPLKPLSFTLVLAGALGTPVLGQAPKPVTLLNVSYDPTRELYEDFNAKFAAYWKGKTGQDVKVRQSHGGSGSRPGPSSTVSRPTWSPGPGLRHRPDRREGTHPAGELAGSPAQQQLALHLDNRVPGPERES